MDKFGTKTYNFQFKLKFVTKTNSNMQSSMVIFNFSVFDQKYHFWKNLVQKMKIFSLTLIWVGVFLPLCWFSLNNSETIKAVNLVFCSINFLLETFMPNLVSLTCPSLQILDRTQAKVFPIFEFLVKSLNKNGHNSETSNHINKHLQKNYT